MPIPPNCSANPVDINEKYETVFLDGRVITPGDEVQERVSSNEVRNSENQIEKNGDHGGVDKAVPEGFTRRCAGQPGDGFTHLKPLEDHDNRRVNCAPYNKICRKRKTAEPNEHRTFHDE
jgi:hypothetical protein